MYRDLQHHVVPEVDGGHPASNESVKPQNEHLLGEYHQGPLGRSKAWINQILQLGPLATPEKGPT